MTRFYSVVIDILFCTESLLYGIYGHWLLFYNLSRFYHSCNKEYKNRSYKIDYTYLQRMFISRNMQSD